MDPAPVGHICRHGPFCAAFHASLAAMSALSRVRRVRSSALFSPWEVVVTKEVWKRLAGRRCAAIRDWDTAQAKVRERQWKGQGESLTICMYCPSISRLQQQAFTWFDDLVGYDLCLTCLLSREASHTECPEFEPQSNHLLPPAAVVQREAPHPLPFFFWPPSLLKPVVGPACQREPT